MRAFIVGWLLAFAAVALGAVGVARLVAASPAPAVSEPVRRAQSQESGDDLGPMFREDEAVEVVARRFGGTPAGEQLSREVRTSAVVTYYSPQHWRVCLAGACWVAHGPGRYAEAENDLGRQREASASPTGR